MIYFLVMLLAITTTWAVVTTIQFFTYIPWYEKGYRKMLEQRDVLYENFRDFASPRFFRLSPLPQDLVNVLTEIEKELSGCT